MLSPKCNRNSVSPPPKALGSPWERNQEEIPGEVVEEGMEAFSSVHVRVAAHVNSE